MIIKGDKMTTQSTTKKKRKIQVSAKTKDAALDMAFAAIDAALSRANPTSKKGKFVKKAAQGTLALFPRRNDPAWYLRRGVVQHGVNLDCPSVTSEHVYSENDVCTGRVDCIASFANILPPGDVWDIQMSSMMAKLRSVTGATQLYTVEDLKHYFVAVREAFSLSCALRAICKAPLVVDRYDTRSTQRYLDELAGTLGEADRNALLRHMPQMRSFVEQMMHSILPYVPKGLPFFERPAFVLSNVFKDAPTKKFNGIAFRFVPSAFGFPKIDAVGVGTKDWSVDDFWFADDAGNVMRAYLAGEPTSGGGTELLNYGYVADDYILSSMFMASNTINSQIPLGGGLITALNGGFTIGENLLGQMVRKIVADDRFALIRGDLDRAYGCRSSMEDLAMNAPLPVLYDPLVCQQLHNASVPVARGSGQTTEQKFNPYFWYEVSVDHAGRGVTTGPAWATFPDGNTGKWGVAAPDLNLNSGALGRYTAGGVGAEDCGLMGAGIALSGLATAAKKIEIPIIVDFTKDDPSSGEVMEVLRWSKAYPLSQFLGSTHNYTNASVMQQGRWEYEAAGTDTITTVSYLYGYQASNNSCLIWSPSIATSQTRIPSFLTTAAKVECSPLYYVVRFVSGQPVAWSVGGAAGNQAPIAHSALKLVLDQGTLSILEP